jgi:hypothetical protein
MKCETKYCRNEADKYRKLCPKCRMRKFRDKNPIGYCYYNLRKRAKKRGKEFTITKAEFKIFCEETNYLELKGRFKNDMSIDRIIDSKGYSYDNIRILSVGKNSSKRGYDNRDEECPF